LGLGLGLGVVDWLIRLSYHCGAFPPPLDISPKPLTCHLWANANVGDNNKIALPGMTGQEPQFQLVTVVAPYVKNQSVWYCPSIGPDYVWEAAVKAGVWKKGATMRTQGTTYWYTYVAWPFPYVPPPT
jgi:hypothetical protein